MLTAVASNNGINISTGSREPSQQKGPLYPASEHLTTTTKITLPEAILSAPPGIPPTDFLK